MRGPGWLRGGLAVSLVIVLLSGVSSGHSGKTDENGGHYNRSTGEYHYHHGYPEHQHTGGACPYDFDDKTGQSSGGGSNKKPKESGKGEKAAKSEGDWGALIILLALVGGPPLLFRPSRDSRKGK